MELYQELKRLYRVRAYYGTDEISADAEPPAYFSRTTPYESRPLAGVAQARGCAGAPRPAAGRHLHVGRLRTPRRTRLPWLRAPPLPLPDDAPALLRAEWDRFVRTAYPRRLLRVPDHARTGRGLPALRRRVCRTPEAYTRLTGQTLPDATSGFVGLRLPAYENSTLWRNFIPQVPLAQLEVLSAEQAWQNFLRTRYSTVQALNTAYGWQLAAFDEARFPTREALAVTFARRGWRDFLVGAFANYRTVGEYLFLRGQAFGNTVLLVLLSVLATLTVNPLAAYALSRFGLRSTEKILLFLLATMAFPAAVTAIPGFLLIRDLGLLNTFAALVLPTLASGMSIFILKGFFDGLPRELYEAAAIDGAKEWQIFLRITLPMTTPILAVNALNAFVHAYNSWEWALLVCQRQSHWTLAVWMYQMSQQLADQPWAVMAGFVLVSIPTAVVFIACQKIILRGIVLPSMK